MKAVVFKAPGQVVLEERPIPQLQGPSDAIVKVRYAGLCGSEMHVYRGIEPVERADFIMGHEFTGIIVEAGSAVKRFQIGQLVTAAFTTSCGSCWACLRGQTARCVESQLFGSPGLDGAQAEYVRVPLADNTLISLAPQDLEARANTLADVSAADIPSEPTLMLLGDVFTTGYYCALNAYPPMVSTLAECGLFTGNGPASYGDIAVVIGCGPVGLCAVASALVLFRKVYAVDMEPSRLAMAQRLGAEPLHGGDEPDAWIEQVRSASSDGRGADAVLEVVGHPSALKAAFAVVRPFGKISSVGVHNSPLPFSATDCYDKNISLTFGRCPVQSVYRGAFELLLRGEHSGARELGGLIDTVVPLTATAVAQAYQDFVSRRVQKVVFQLDKK